MPDSTPLRALAHPLRSRILAQLRLHGEASATTLAAALGTHTGATSYHLRALADAGLIEEVPGRRGRSRWWRAVAGAGVIPDEPADEDEAAMIRWLQQDYVQHFADQSTRWIDDGGRADEPWRSTCGLQDAGVLVSAEQLVALRAELDEVLDRYRRAGQGTPGARRVAVYTSLLPLPTG